MRRLGVMILVLFLSLATALPAAAASRLLYWGSLGDDVAKLQASLARLGYQPGPIDGDFGALTWEAVRAFQSRQGLPADGAVGPDTWAALERALGGDSSRSGASYERYIVRSGDSLFFIAQRYGMGVDDLLRANALPSPDWIYPGQALAIPRIFPQAPPATPEPARPLPGGFDVVGYYVQYFAGDNLSWNSYRTYEQQISTVAAFSHGVNWDGSVSGQACWDLLESAQAAGKPVLALVHNIGAGGGFDSDLAHAVLSNATLRKATVRSIARTVRSCGYAGVNIDFESIYTWDRASYTAFIRELASDLQGDGHLVTLSVPAKTWDDPYNAWSGAFDYKALGQIADAIMIMTYDENWSGSGAGPVASLGWVKQVMDYATSVIPAKIIRMGIAAYGYDWDAAGYDGRAVTAREAASIAQRYGATVQWDSYSQCPYFIYWPGSRAREVWFENPSSIAAKIDLAASYGLGGIAIWRLGFEEPGMWKVIADKV